MCATPPLPNQLTFLDILLYSILGAFVTARLDCFESTEALFRLGARALIPGTEMGIVQIPWCPRSNRVIVRLFIVRHSV